MTLTLSTDLSVNTSPTQVEEKLQEKQKALRDSIEKGEPKVFGVAQIVIGLLIISYSLPLLSAERTMTLNFGLPWWSGLMFVISGAAAILLEKYANLKAVSVCLAVSAVTIIVSVIALILYYADVALNPATRCYEGHQMCDHQYYATRFTTGLKTIISMVCIIQTAMSSAFTAILYNQRRNFTGYGTMVEGHLA